MKHLTWDFLRNKQSLSLGMAFFALGFLFGSWATFIPHVKEKFNLNDAELGLMLLCMPAGSMIMNALGAILVTRLGARKSTLLGMIMIGFAFMIPLNMNLVFMLPLALFFCGSSIAIINVSMNSAVTYIEKSFAINIMSTCHGMFSIGLMISSILASFARGLGAVPGLYMIGAGTFILILAAIIKKQVMAIAEEGTDEKGEKTRLQLPKGPLLIIIIIAMCGNITEGTMADWTSVYMRDVVNTSPYYVGWGLAGYSFFMALGRFFGDSLIPKIGANKILIYGGMVTISGLLIALVFPYTWTAILGFALVGAGVSCEAPILYASASRVPGMGKGKGLALMNTFAMGGFLFGPVLIGFVSEASSLQLAMSLCVLLAIMWSFLATRVKLF